MIERNYNIQSWAITKEGKRIHIREAILLGDSSKYFCPECSSPMVMKNGEVRAAHFSHLASQSHNPLCSYGDETYRHKIAKELLQRQGWIKTPAVVYYYPPQVKEGKYTLKEEGLEKPDSIQIERYISENSRGELIIGREAKEHILLKPDATFLVNEKASLLIEFTATHKSDPEKIAKLQQIRINTLEISIPASANEKDIEEILQNTSNSKWLYHDELAQHQFTDSRRDPGDPEASSEYDSLPYTPEFIYKCVLYQIAEQVRRVNRFVQSAEFGKRQASVRAEIDRIGTLIESERGIIGKHKTEEESLKRAILTALPGRERSLYEQLDEELRREESKLKEEESNFEQKSQDLERRYKSKARELKQEQGNVREHYSSPAEKIRTDIRELQEQLFRDQQDLDFVKGEIKRVEDRIAENRTEINSFENTGKLQQLTESGESFKLRADQVQKAIERIEYDHAGCLLRANQKIGRIRSVLSKLHQIKRDAGIE